MIARTVFSSTFITTSAGASAVARFLFFFKSLFISCIRFQNQYPPLTTTIDLQFLLISWYFSSFCTSFFRLSLWPSRGPVHYFSPFLIFDFVIIISTTPSPPISFCTHTACLIASAGPGDVAYFVYVRRFTEIPYSHPERSSMPFLSLVSIPIIATLQANGRLCTLSAEVGEGGL
jgi:hypothetical protein